MIQNNRRWMISPKTYYTSSTTTKLHHLYNNRGVYWLSLTLVSNDGLTTRERFNLRTRSMEKAIRVRDTILEKAKNKWFKTIKIEK